jgi:hypothetical protein
MLLSGDLVLETGNIDHALVGVAMADYLAGTSKRKKIVTDIINRDAAGRSDDNKSVM